MLITYSAPLAINVTSALAFLPRNKCYSIVNKVNTFLAEIQGNCVSKLLYWFS